MSSIAKHYAISLITLYSLDWLLPTLVVKDAISLLLASAVLTVNLFVLRPVLKLLFLPLTVITLGLFSLVINAFLIWLIGYLVPGFVILPTMLFGVGLNYFASLILASFLITSVYTAVDILL